MMQTVSGREGTEEFDKQLTQRAACAHHTEHCDKARKQSTCAVIGMHAKW